MLVRTTTAAALRTPTILHYCGYSLLLTTSCLENPPTPGRNPESSHKPNRNRSPFPWSCCSMCSSCPVTSCRRGGNVRHLIIRTLALWTCRMTCHACCSLRCGSQNMPFSLSNSACGLGLMRHSAGGGVYYTINTIRIQ